MNRSSVEIRCTHAGRATSADPRLLDVWHADGGRWWSAVTAMADPAINGAEVRETRRGWVFTCPTCREPVQVRHVRLCSELTNRLAAGETTVDLRKLAE